MNKIIKRILTIVLCLSLTTCLCLAVASCKGIGPNSTGSAGGEEIASIETIAPPDDGLEKCDFEITVQYPDGTNVGAGIEVQLYVNGDTEAYSGATTSSKGVAKIKASKEQSYYVVLRNIPDDYAYGEGDALSVGDTKATVRLELINMDSAYAISVESVGGMKLSNVNVTLKSNGATVASKKTNEKGVAQMAVSALGVYDIEISNLPRGYAVNGDSMKTSADVNELVVKAESSITGEAPNGYVYSIDEIMYDFTIVDTEGKTRKLSELAKDKKMVLLNFWATWCTPCKAEFPSIQEIYEDYGDDIEVVAISSTDTASSVKAFQESTGYTFVMSPDNSGNRIYDMFSKFSGGSAVPTTIFIDRYGKITNFIKGSGTQQIFKYFVEKYISDEYVQTKYDATESLPEIEPDKPNVDMPLSEEIVNAVNKNFDGTYKKVAGEYTWPWVLKDVEGAKVLTPGNLGCNNTTASIDYEFKLGKGEFLTFEYKMNTEDVGNADILDVYIDGTWMKTMEVVTADWVTCYLYTPLSDSTYITDAEDVDRTHTLTLTYTRDNSDGFLVGNEVVAFRNIRKVAQNDLPKEASVNVMREASWIQDETNGYKNYVDVVLASDGYYHVGGEDGPYLLANLMNMTHYSNMAVSEYVTSILWSRAGLDSQLRYMQGGMPNPGKGSYIENDKSYLWVADVTTVPGYTLVDERLAIILDLMVDKFHQTTYQDQLIGKFYHEKTWLEFCNYFENFSGKDMGSTNIMTGLLNKAAIPANIGTSHVVLDRVLVPRGLVHEFKCENTGVYRVYSILGELAEFGGYMYITGEDVRKEDDSIGNFGSYVSFEEGKTYYIGVALGTPSDLGEFDFVIEYIGESIDSWTYAAPGSYTFVLDDDGNFALDDDGNYIMVIARNNNFQFELGSDGKYHQLLKDGTIDKGDKSYVWIDILSGTNLFTSYSIEDLVNGYVMSGDKKISIGFEELGYDSEGKLINFFDFSGDGGEDYRDVMREYITEAKKNTEGETAGTVIADEQLVKILSKALKRIGHNEDAWLAMAYYYEHVGAYTPQA